MLREDIIKVKVIDEVERVMYHQCFENVIEQLKAGVKNGK